MSTFIKRFFDHFASDEQFDKLERMANKEKVDLADRQLVEAFVQRIEINPDAKTGG